MKKITSLFCVILATAILVSGLSINASAAFTPTKNSLNSKAVYMVNTDTDTVIYRQNEHKQLYPASFVKVMVAVMVLEKYSDPKKVEVTAPAYIYNELYEIGGASTADIRQGEKVTMLDLLYALILPSACEAASIIADHIGEGDISKFIEDMNARAKELGCENTNFVNPHGLHNPDQLTTAYDMYLITKHALTFPLFKKISSSRQYEMPATNKHSKPRFIYHTNTMMTASSSYYYPYIKGIKTGTTDESGKNLVSTASKDGYNYLLITMGAPTVYDNGARISDNLCFIDTENLYDWAFDNYAVKTIVKKENSVADVKIRLSWDTDHLLLTPQNDVSALLPTNADPSTVQQIVNIPESIDAPVKEGDLIGTMSLKLNNEEIATVNLIASQSVDSNPILIALDFIKSIISSLAFKIIFAIIVLLIIGYIIVIVLYNKKVKQNRVRRPAKKYRRSKPTKRR